MSTAASEKPRLSMFFPGSPVSPGPQAGPGPDGLGRVAFLAEPAYGSRRFLGERRMPMETGSTKRPAVAIVGRPNVGKSALFNRLAGRRISIVHDQPGVTRDRISAICRQGPIPFEVVDTGGIGASLDDDFAGQVRAEAEIAVEAADLILWVVDAQEGVTTIDEELAGVLRKSAVPVLVVANKVDADAHENLVADFGRLGFGNPFPVSAEHGRHVSDLIRSVGKRLKQDFEPGPEGSGGDEARICLAVVGKPNVGKSSLINAILEDDRTIVSEVAGTTRDAVDVPYDRGGKRFTLIDTAGMRRKTKRDSAVEVFSVMRSERSIRRADLCLLVIDAAAGITAMDRTIARTIVDENKPCIIIANKFDHVAAFQNFLIMPLTFLSGVFYSVHGLPELWLQASLFNPFFYLIDGFRWGFFGSADMPFARSLVWALGFFAVSSTMAALARGWRLRA